MGIQVTLLGLLHLADQARVKVGPLTHRVLRQPPLLTPTAQLHAEEMPY